VIGLKQLAGGVVGGAFAIKFVPTPFLIVGIFVGLSYVTVRLLVWVGRGVTQKLSEIEVQWPDLGVLRARRRMAEVMAMADQRILELKDEVAAAQTRVGELEVERHKFDGVLQMADRRIEELTGELQNAKAALEAAGEELRRRRADGEDPLYHRVGLSKDAQNWLIADCRRSFRRKLHPDSHPAHRKQACHERFVEAEQVFDRIYLLRGMKT
jgi:hypothetical protein